MLAYLIRCFLILLGIWLTKYFHLVPWSDLINLMVIVVVPLVLIGIGMRHTAKDIIRRATGTKPRN